ncbi:MAG: PD-(D/E)XK nuclease family protein [Nanoarchaeota archaeon]|nr:PD-(D/E)XK nuclease family protein [Nanoarchaeota archaeon]
MAKRIQSPSSINLYNQCPRRYFYQYILKLPTKPSIHLIRGSVVHKVLEKFFSIDINAIDKKEYEFGLRSYVKALFLKSWKNKAGELAKLSMTNEQLEHYLVDSLNMLSNFVNQFCIKLDEKIKKTHDLSKAFKQLVPSVEEALVSKELSVRGFIDAIHEGEGDIVIVDYKTSNKDIMTEGYRLQLAIYALLYKLKYGKTPKKVGINFLKYGEKYLDVDQELMDDALREILFIHERTETDNIVDYPRRESGLCKWHSGECDFYNECMKNK